MQDPVFTPIFTALVGTGTLTIGSISVSYAAILSAIATTAITVGISAALAPRPEDGHAPLQQGIPPRVWAVGKVRLAGGYMLHEEKNGTLFAVIALCGHRVNNIVSLMLHDDHVVLDEDGVVEEGDDGRYGGENGFFGIGATSDIVKIKTRVGLPTETAYEHITEWLGPEGIWTENHRGDGQASLGMTVNSPPAESFRKRLPHGIPKPSAIVEAARVWDFRDPDQDPDDPSTWTFSRNSILILAWQEFFNEFGSRKDYRVGLLPVLDHWIEEADICDEIVPLASGGTVARYECNGWAHGDQDPKIGRNSILATCDGWICERGDGAILPVVGKFRENRVEVLTDADLCGYSLLRNIAKEDRINRLIPNFTYPATDYSTTETDYWEDEDAILQDGRPLAQAADYGWCHVWQTARRLGLREWKRLRVARRGSLDVRLSGLNAVYSRWVRLECPNMIPSMNGKVIENRSSRISLMSAGLQMDFAQHPTDLDDWDPFTDEGLAPPIPLKPDTALIPDPTGLTFTVEQRTVAGNVTSLVLAARATPPVRSDYTFEAEFAPNDTEDWQAMPVAASKWEAFSGPIQAEAVYDGRARVVGPGNTPGEWTYVPNIIASLPPAALTETSVTTGTANTGKVGINYTTAASTPSPTTNVKVYRAPTGVTLNKTTHLVATNGVSPGTPYAYTDGDATRTNALANPDFSTNTDWAGTSWSIGSGIASKAVSNSSALAQAVAALGSAAIGSTWSWGVNLLSMTSGGSFVGRLSGGTNVNSSSRTTTGLQFGDLVKVAGNNTFNFVVSGASIAASLDDAVFFERTPSCVPRGTYDYYLEPVNALGVSGPLAGPFTAFVY